MRLARAIYLALLTALGVALAVAGTTLLWLGGSAYYAIADVTLLVSAWFLWRGRPVGVRIFAALWLFTIAWALWEAGFDGWALAPRLILLSVIGAGLFVPSVRGTQGVSARAMVAATVGAILVGALGCQMGSAETDPLYRVGVATMSSHDVSAETSATDSTAPPTSDDWPHYGNDAGGSRFSPLTQINRGNVAQLQLAWSFHTGDTQTSLEVTPIKIGETVYLCTGGNDVIALDAQTGVQRWRFNAGASGSAAILKACRGVAYFKAPDPSADCAERILTNTIDARLIALDAHTGQLCKSFGSGGQVSLLKGMGDAQGRTLPGYYYVTSAPTIIHARVVLGGWVSDAQYWGEPSGVVRAFDAMTGEFAWAFDMGRPDRQSEPPAGEQYTPSTPNAWAPMSADEVLGLVYVPTGNTTGSDYYGALRRPFDDQYSSSVVAIDADTGRVRWSFQTVHHDLWDYDVAPQPVLADIRRSGDVVQALIQPTKTGEIFVLDRRTGAPLSPVREVPVSRAGAVPEERVSPTQPSSVAMPSFRGPDLQERDMWGLTPLDQLWCRIQFRRARYAGIYTPPGTTPFIQYPGILGGIEWNSVSVDAAQGVMIVNASRVANYAQLVPRSEADAQGRKAEGLGGHYMARAQLGTPYAVTNPPFLSPLGVPCQQPPFGTLSGVDLSTGKLLWTQRLGTARDSGPFKLPSMLPFALGTPNLGGSVITRSGLVFIGASQDRYLRAIDAASGAELWKARLPAGAQATPMTYVSAQGRQFIVVAAGGNGGRLSEPGDTILAYALPH